MVMVEATTVSPVTEPLLLEIVNVHYMIWNIDRKTTNVGKILKGAQKLWRQMQERI